MKKAAKNSGAMTEQQGYGVEVRPGMLVETADPERLTYDAVVLSVAEHGAFVRYLDDETVAGVTWDRLTIKPAAPVPVSE